ncbi:hypothetical protein BGC30_02405 [Novacetimonas hansenii]|nr:hypothetical protein BGC30_02405 [Novacetimonas hansenii]
MTFLRSRREAARPTSAITSNLYATQGAFEKRNDIKFLGFDGMLMGIFAKPTRMRLFPGDKKQVPLLTDSIEQNHQSLFLAPHIR